MTKIPMTERVFYSDKFDSLESEQKKEAIADLDAVFENDIKVLPPEKQAVARATYQRDKETKLSEMGYNDLIPTKIETNIPQSTLIPETKKEAIDLSQEAPQLIARREQLGQIQQEDKPLDDQTLMMAFPMSGALHAAKGAAVGSQAAVRSGIAVAKAETAAEVGAQLASAGIDEFTSDEFKQENPNYYMAMQLLGTLVTAGTLGTVVYNKSIQKYDKVSQAVNEGKISIKQAEEAIQDVNKIAEPEDLTEINKYLEETAPEKVSTVEPTKDIEIAKDDVSDIDVGDIKPTDTKFKAKTMYVGNETINKTDFDLIQAYQKNREFNRNNPTQKRDIPQKQIDAYKNNSNIADDLKDMEFTSIKEVEGLSAKVPPEALGVTLGFKQNEDGTYTYDVSTGLLGAVGARVAKQAFSNKQLQQFAKETLDELPGATNRAVKKLTGVDIEPSITSGAKVKIDTKSKVCFNGSCDRIRMTPKGETFWQDMMKNKEPIKEKDFLSKVNIDEMLDEGETFKDFKNEALGQSDNVEFFKAKDDTYFLKTGDFEYIWSKNKKGFQKVEDVKKPTPKKEDKLYATHRTTINNFSKMLDEGVLPAPSFAVAKNSKVSDQFGDIIVVPKEKHIDPKKGAYAYGGDAYTPRIKFDEEDIFETIDLKAPVFDRFPKLKSIAKDAGDSSEFYSLANNDPKVYGWIDDWAKKTGRDTDDLIMTVTNQIYKETKPSIDTKLRAIKKLVKDNDGDLRGLEDAFTPSYIHSYKQLKSLSEMKDRGQQLKTYKSKDKFYDEAAKAISKGEQAPADYMEAKRLDKVKLSDMSRIIVPADQYDEVVAMLKEKGIDVPVVRQRANETSNSAIKRSSDKKSEYIHSSPTAGSALFGASAGAEVDEDGNFSYNLAKGAIGAVGGAVAYKGGSKLYNMYKNKSIKIPEGQLPPETKGQIWQRIMQDKFNRIKQLQKVKAGSEKISDALDVYRAEERYSGRTQYRIDKFQQEKVDPLLKFIAAKNISIDDIDSYLHARHAFERNAQMKKVSGIENGSGMSNQEASIIINKFRDNANMNDIVKSINKISKDRLKLIKDEGLESEQFIADIEGLYKNYVPLKRDMSDKFQQVGGGTGKGFSIKGKETKRAKGSIRKVESPFMHTILDYQETLTRAEKNKVGQTFLKFTDEFPDKDLYEVESLKYMPKYDKDGNITSVDPLYKTGENIFHVKVDGKIKQIELKDEGLAVALKNINPAQMNGVTKVMHKMTRFLAALNTQYNPEFVVGNFERDLQAAMINLPKEMKPKYGSFLKDVPKAIRGIYRDERGKALTTEYQKLFDELKKEGGTTGWMEQYEVPELKADLEKTIRKYEGKDLPSNAFKSVLKYIDDVNTSVENGVRLVAYKQSKDAGLSTKEAASIAKNLTVNFNRKGTAGTTINAAYMFYNASIQGSVRMIRALKDSKRAKGAVAGIAGLSYGLHQYNNMQNKDAYNKIPQWEKDTNYILMNKDGTYSKIKVPYGYNVFKTVGDVIAEVQDGQIDIGEAKTRAFSTIVNAFSPIGASSDPVTSLVPTVAKPFYEMKTNENFFGGKIKPEGNPFQPEKLAESHRSYKSVNPIAKQFTQELNELTGGTKHVRGEIDISPEYIEHLVEFMGGGLAKLASRTTTSIDKAIKGEKQEVNKIPFLRLFKGKVREKADIHESYTLYKESSRKILSKFKTDKFNKSINSAINNKEIDAKKGFRLKKKFKDNQIRVKWSKAKDIQSTKEGQKNIKTLIKSGGSKTDVKNILLNKEK